MYSENIIKLYGEDKIYNFLKNKGTIELASHDEETANFNFAIENYLVKYRNSNDPIINHYIDNIFKAFNNNPLIYSYSYILSNELIVNSLINNNENRKLFYIYGKKKLSSNWENTYKKIMNNQPVSTYDRERLNVLFTLGIRTGNRQAKDKIEKYVNKLLYENKIPNNDFEKLLLFNYASRKTLGYEYNMVDTFIRLVDIKSGNGFTGGYEKDGYIVMNDHPSSFSFYQTLDQMIQCVCHETTHTIQEQQAINDPYNVHAMEMAIQKLFAFDEYQTGDNYLFNEIEENAQRNGYHNATIIYSLAGRDDIAMKLIREKSDYIKKRRFQYEYVTVNENGTKKIISKEKYNVENIRRIVKKNPNLLSEFPVLNNLFDRFGNPKPLDIMLSEDFKSHDIRYMYTDFIIYDFRHDGLNKINLNNKSEEYKYNVLNNLCSIFQDLSKKTLDIIKDYKYRNNHISKTSFFYKQSLDDVIKLAKYIEKELPFMRDYEKRHTGNYNLYSTYTSSLRTLLNNIDIYKSDNHLTNLEKITDDRKNELDDLDLNMKKEYINYILEHFSYKERATVLFVNNNYITLEKYIKTEVLAHLTRDHYLRDNNGRIIMGNNSFGENPVNYIRKIYDKYKISELDNMFSNNNSSNIRNVNQVRYR